jgi:hypothetical protein
VPTTSHLVKIMEIRKVMHLETLFSRSLVWPSPAAAVTDGGYGSWWSNLARNLHSPLFSGDVKARTVASLCTLALSCNWDCARDLMLHIRLPHYLISHIITNSKIQTANIR